VGGYQAGRAEFEKKLLENIRLQTGPVLGKIERVDSRLLIHIKDEEKNIYEEIKPIDPNFNLDVKNCEKIQTTLNDKSQIKVLNSGYILNTASITNRPTGSAVVG
jgi:hypothetical protein